MYLYVFILIISRTLPARKSSCGSSGASSSLLGRMHHDVKSAYLCLTAFFSSCYSLANAKLDKLHQLGESRLDALTNRASTATAEQSETHADVYKVPD